MDCNDSNLEKISNKVYKTECGYFLFKEHGKWMFLPHEREFDDENLLNIINTLKNLNEHTPQP